MNSVSFGHLSDGRATHAWTLGGDGLTATILTYGARLAALRPRPDGRSAVLGFDTAERYERDTSYQGAVVGRVGNRIGGGAFRLDGRTIRLPTNNGPNTLHGGPVGFDRAVWSADTDGDSLLLHHISLDGDQGFPGTVKATVRYTVRGDTLEIDYTAETDAPTVVNLTNHAYFNLDGSPDITGHTLTLHADRFTPTNAQQIPTGELRPVDNTPFDFRTPHRIGERIDAEDEQLRHGRGYDHNFVLIGKPGPEPRLAATVSAGDAQLTVLTTAPGVQFYSGNMMPESGLPYRGALCLETQFFPDSPNQPSFPSIVLRPGEIWRSTTVLKLSGN